MRIEKGWRPVGKRDTNLFKNCANLTRIFANLLNNCANHKANIANSLKIAQT
jgi:hypothetical protein